MENARASKYTLKQKASKTRAKVNNLGKLIYVPSTYCGACHQQGHDARTCRGKGYIKATVDKVVADIYEHRDQIAREKAQAGAAAEDEAADEPADDSLGDSPGDFGNGEEELVTDSPGDSGIDEEQPVSDSPGDSLDHMQDHADEEDDEEADPTAICDYGAFYERQAKFYERTTSELPPAYHIATCQNSQETPVPCWRCKADHHRDCFLKADQYSEEHVVRQRTFGQEESLCFQCFCEE